MRGRTLYQFISIPASRKIWFQIPGYQDWVQLDLSGGFKEGMRTLLKTSSEYEGL
ncbi:MAG: hypothetical protein ACLFQV_01770 [Vulcanimicrobiota bacterium]